MTQDLNTISSGNGKPKIIFLPGNSSTAKSFEPLFQFLPNNHCIAIDYPGCGGSFISGDPSNDYTYSSLKKAVIKKINDIDGQKILVGHSLGGHILSEISGNISKIKALVIAAAPPVKQPLNLDEAFIPNDISEIFYKGEVDKEHIDLYIKKATIQKMWDTLIVADFLSTDPEFRKSIGSTIFDEIEDEIISLQSLSIPIFAIHGLDDPMISCAYLESLSLFSEVLFLKGCGHYPHLEQPGKFADFLYSITNDLR